MEKHGRERERGKGDSAEGGLFRAKYKGEQYKCQGTPSQRWRTRVMRLTFKYRTLENLRPASYYCYRLQLQIGPLDPPSSFCPLPLLLFDPDSRLIVSSSSRLKFPDSLSRDVIRARSKQGCYFNKTKLWISSLFLFCSFVQGKNYWLRI